MADSINKIYDDYFLLFTKKQEELTSALDNLAATIPQLNLPDFFNTLSQRYPTYGYSQEKADLPTDPLTPEYDFDPAALWSGWTLTPESLRYDSPFLEQLEQKCRDLVLNAHTIISGMSYDGVASFQALFDAAIEQDSRDLCDAVLADKSQYAGRGFPMPTHIIARSVSSRLDAYRTKRTQLITQATQQLMEAVHSSVEFALGQGVQLEELRSRLTQRFQAVYREAVDYQLARYRESVEYASRQMTSALEYGKLQQEQITLNEKLSAQAYTDAVQNYEQRYERAFKTANETYKAAENDFNRRLDGIQNYVNYYASYIASLTGASRGINFASTKETG